MERDPYCLARGRPLRGYVGLGTEGDSVTYFDELAIEAAGNVKRISSWVPSTHLRAAGLSSGTSLLSVLEFDATFRSYRVQVGSISPPDSFHAMRPPPM